VFNSVSSSLNWIAGVLVTAVMLACLTSVLGDEAFEELETRARVRMCGGCCQIDGVVERGDQRGRDLGFPTANLRTPDALLLPGSGVYAGRALVDEATHTAAINIGVNPTFGREPLHLEAYLLDFDGDLRGKVLAIEFWERLRDELAFDSADALAAKIAEDVERTRRIVASGASDLV
jgi:riboflavin kinase / FMN adenylyltransferase